MQVVLHDQKLYIPDSLATAELLCSLTNAGFSSQEEGGEEVRGLMCHPRYWFVLNHRLSKTSMSLKMWCKRGKIPPLQTKNNLDAVRVEYLQEDMLEYFGVEVEPIRLPKLSLSFCVATGAFVRKHYDQDYRNYEGL